MLLYYEGPEIIGLSSPLLIDPKNEEEEDLRFRVILKLPSILKKCTTLSVKEKRIAASLVKCSFSFCYFVTRGAKSS